MQLKFGFLLSQRSTARVCGTVPGLGHVYLPGCQSGTLWNQGFCHRQQGLPPVAQHPRLHRWKHHGAKASTCKMKCTVGYTRTWNPMSTFQECLHVLKIPTWTQAERKFKIHCKDLWKPLMSDYWSKPRTSNPPQIVHYMILPDKHQVSCLKNNCELNLFGSGISVMFILDTATCNFCLSQPAFHPQHWGCFGV